MLKKTLLMLTGGHTIVVKGIAPAEVEHIVSVGREADDYEFCYLQTSDRADNTIIVDPRCVVGIVAVGNRP